MQVADYGTIGTALAMIYMAFTAHMAAKKAAVAAALAERERIAAAELAKKQLEVSKTIHVLVNSQMGEQKRQLMISTAALFAITKSPTDGEAARAAAESYNQHEAKQRTADQLATQT